MFFKSETNSTVFDSDVPSSSTDDETCPVDPSTLAVFNSSASTTVIHSDRPGKIKQTLPFPWNDPSAKY